MKTTFTTTLLGMVVALSGAATPLLGQGGGGSRGGFGGPRLQMMVGTAIEHQADLSITEEQRTQLDELAREVAEVVQPITEEMRSLRQSGNREAMRDMFSKLQETEAPYVERFEGILSEEQRTALLEYIPRPRRRGGQG